MAPRKKEAQAPELNDGGEALPPVDETKPEEQLEPEEEDPAQESRLDAFEDAAAEALEILDVQADVRLLAANLRDAMLEIFRHRQMPWDQMREGEQRELVNYLERVVDAAMKSACRQIAEDGRPSIDAQLVKFSSKSGAFQVTLEANGGPDMAGDLARMDGHHVLIISADAERYTKRRPAETKPDQAPLEFDDPEPKAPASPFDTVEEQNVLVPNLEEGTMDLTNRDSGAVINSRPMTIAERAAADFAADEAERLAQDPPADPEAAARETDPGEEPPAEPAEEE